MEGLTMRPQDLSGKQLDAGVVEYLFGKELSKQEIKELRQNVTKDGKSKNGKKASSRGTWVATTVQHDVTNKLGKLAYTLGVTKETLLRTALRATVERLEEVVPKPCPTCGTVKVNGAVANGR